jgi:putative endonuclease
MTDTATDPARKGRNRALGDYGERVAARYLVDRGMVVLDRNWRCDEGELDLVLRDGPALVGCEVKTRTSLSHGSPHEAVTDAKLARLRSLLERWSRAHDVPAPDSRIDLVAVLRPPRGRALVEHVRGIG